MFDSHYEYLLKLWISTADLRYKERYFTAAEAIRKHLVVYTPDQQLAYVPQTELIPSSNYATHDDSFHHLVCLIRCKTLLTDQVMLCGRNVHSRG